MSSQPKTSTEQLTTWLVIGFLLFCLLMLVANRTVTEGNPRCTQITGQTGC